VPQGFTSNLCTLVYACSPLREGGYLLAAGEDRSILFGQSGHPFGGAGLANLHDHEIVTPLEAGVSLFYLFLADIPQRGAIELENLFRTNRAVLSRSKRRLVRDCDSHKAHASLTLGIFDDLELGGHFFFPLGDDVVYETFFVSATPLVGGHETPIQAAFSTQ